VLAFEEVDVGAAELEDVVDVVSDEPEDVESEDVESEDPVAATLVVVVVSLSVEAVALVWVSAAAKAPIPAVAARLETPASAVNRRIRVLARSRRLRSAGFVGRGMRTTVKLGRLSRLGFPCVAPVKSGNDYEEDTGPSDTAPGSPSGSSTNIGSTTVKITPPEGRSAAVTVPPWAVTMAPTIESPSPAPPL